MTLRASDSSESAAPSAADPVKPFASMHFAAEPDLAKQLHRGCGKLHALV
jgi:hypothetical protein